MEFAAGMLAVGACVVVAACGTTTHVAPVAARQSAATQGEKLAMIKFDRVVFGIDVGQYLGTYRGSPVCGAPGPINWSGKSPVLQREKDMAEKFFQSMTRANYRVAGDPNQLFEEYAADSKNPDYLIGAVVRSINADMCNEFDLWSGNFTDRESGTVAINVTWQVFSTLERKVVYETKTSGSATLTSSLPDALVVLIEDAFGAAAINLAADSKLHSLLMEPASTASESAALSNASELAIPRELPFAGGITANAERIEESVVTVVTGGGHGSGFFVAPTLVLTNQHVVGGSKRVKLQFVDGSEIYATVLRSRPDRDVALLEIEEDSYQALPVRDTAVNITEEVYAIGSPLDESLSGTVTRGIVSQIKTDEQGRPLIQADASVQPGNSGGPLLDKDGNVVGIAVAGLMNQADSSVGINFFIPIGDALEKLNIVIR